MAVQYDSDKNSWGGFIVDIYKAKKGIVEVGDEFKKFYENAKAKGYNFEWFYNAHNQDEIKQWIDNLKLSDDNLKQFLKTWDGVGDISQAFQQYLKDTQGGLTGFSGALNKAKGVFRGFGAALGSMAAMWAIGEVIGLAVTAFNNFANSAENAKKAAEGFNSSIKSMQSEFASNTTKINELNSEYKKLSKDVSHLGENINLTSKEYDRYKDLVSQISDIMPNLTVRFNEQGEKIGFATGKLKDLNEQYKTYKKNEAHRILTEGNENGETLSDIIKNYNNQNKVGLWSAVLNAFKAPFTGKGYDKIFSNEDLVKYLSDLRELGQRSQEGVAEALGESSQFSTAFDAPQKAIRNIVGYGKEDILSMKPDDFNAFLETLDTLIEKYSGEIDFASSQIGNSLLLIAQTKDEYWGLDEKTQYVDTLLTSMSDDMLKFANILDESGKMNDINMRTFVNRTIKVLQDNEGGISNAFNELFKIDLDDETLNPIEIYEKVNSYIDTIYEALGFDEEEAKEGKKNLKILLGFEVTEDNYNDYQNALRYFNTRKTSPDNPFPLFDMDRQAELEAWSKENDVTQEELENLKKNGYSAKNSIEELTNAIIKMRKENAPDKLPFDNAWNQLKNNSGAFKDNDDTKDTANNLLELAKAGKLTAKAFEKTKGSDDFLTQTKLSAEEATKQINELVDSSKHLSELKKGINAIGSAYNEKKDSKQNTVSSDTLSSMYDTLGIDTWTKKDKKVWEEYKNAATDASAPVKKLKTYQDELATSYLNSNNFLSNLDGTTEEHYKTLLKDMGIKNAEKIVDDQLIANSQVQKNKSEALSAATEDLGNKTWNTSKAFLKQAKMSKLAKVQLIDLISKEKIFSKDSGLSTDKKIKELNKLSKAYFKTGFSVQLAGVMGSDSRFFGEGDVDAFIEKKWKEYLKGIRKTFQTDIDIDPTVTDPKDKSKDKKSSQQFDFIQIKLERLQNQYQKYISKAENGTLSLTKRTNNYSKALSNLTKQINTQDKAYTKYMNKANKVKLSDNLKKKIREGSIDIRTLKGNKTVKNNL